MFEHRLLDRLFPRSYAAKFLLIAFVATHLPLISVAVLFALNPELPHTAFLVNVLVAALVGFGVMLLLVPRLLEPIKLTLRLLEAPLDGDFLPETFSEDESGQLLKRASEVLSRLNSSETRYTALFHAIPDGISCFNRQGEYTEIKPPRYFSNVDADLIGKTPEDLYTPELATMIRDARQRMWASGDMQSYELTRAINGHISYREVSIFPLSNTEGAALVRDISERKQTEQQLQESEARFRGFFEANPQPCLIVDVQGDERGEFMQVNHAFSDFIGGIPDDLTRLPLEDINQYIQSITYPEDFAQEQHYIDGIYRGGRDHYHMDKRYIHSDGSLVWGDYSNTISRDEHGNLKHIFATIQDITERKHAEQHAAAALEQLRVSEAQFRAFFEDSSTPCFMVTLQPDHMPESQRGQFLVNDAFCAFLGENAAHLQDMTFTDIDAYNQQVTHPEDHSHEQALVNDVLTGKTSSYRLEKRLIRRDGKEVWGDLTNHALRDAQGNVYQFIAVIQDISEQKRAQLELQDTLEQLQTSEAKFRAFFEGSSSAHSIITMQDPDTARDDRMLVNPAFTNLMADTVFNDLTVHTLADVTTLNEALSHPEDLSTERQHSRTLMSGEIPSYHLEKRFLKRDGDVIWTNVNHSLIKNAGLLVSTVQDITDLKRIQTELSQTLKQLESTLKSKNMLMREIHHRIKNNLQVVASLLNLQTKVVSDQAAKDALNESRKRVMAMAEIHELMHRSDARNDIDFAAYLTKLVALMKRSYSLEAIDIVLELSPVTLPLDQAVPLALIANELISNALKYAFPENYNQPTVTLYLQQQDTTVMLCVEDNGVGSGGLQTDSNDETLGMTIIKTLSEQLGGTLTFTNKATDRTTNKALGKALGKAIGKNTNKTTHNAIDKDTDTTIPRHAPQHIQPSIELPPTTSPSTPTPPESGAAHDTPMEMATGLQVTLNFQRQVPQTS